ncbi:MAG: hypothetical protein AAF078_02280 [Planctomycetota bacterium]
MWVASFPRSGNTLLRAVLHRCFGLKSASIYGDDLGSNAALEAIVGHVAEPAALAGQRWGPLKTHGVPADGAPAVVVVRDPRAAVWSLHRYHGGRMRVEDIVAGRMPFEPWERHTAAWVQRTAPTHVVRYEDLVGRSEATLEGIGTRLGLTRCGDVPTFEEMHAASPLYARGGVRWEAGLTAEQVASIEARCLPLMERLGYQPHGASADGPSRGPC